MDTLKDFYKQHKGLVVAGIVVLAIIGLGALGNTDKNQSKTTTSSATINKDVQTKCMADVNDTTFCRFAGTFTAVGDYSGVLSSTSSGVTSKVQVAIAANGDGTMTIQQGDAASSSIVVFGGSTYVQDPTDHQWLSYALGDSNAPALVDMKKEIAKADFKNSSGQKDQYVNKGTEKVNGLNCYKYQIIDPSKPDQIGYMWFDTSDYLLRKLSSKDATTDMTMTFTYGKVSVTQPYPVKGPASN